MREAPPPLLPILRSQVQGQLLATTYLSPDDEFTVTDLARRAGASVKAMAHEVSRLVAAGLLSDRRVGTARLVRRGPRTPMTGPMTDLLAVTYGPVPVLSEELAGVQGVEQAFVYGSWAARFHGEPGPVPGDVDVLVVGDASLDALDDVAQRAEVRLGRQVSVHRVSRDRWESPPPADAFLASLRSRPLVPLTLAKDVAS